MCLLGTAGGLYRIIKSVRVLEKREERQASSRAHTVVLVLLTRKETWIQGLRSLEKTGSISRLGEECCKKVGY